MAKKASMDIVSEYDTQELKNAVNTCEKEIKNRFDFKGVDFSISLNENTIEIISESENKNTAIIDTLRSKSIKRGLSPLLFSKFNSKDIGGSKVKTIVSLINGIEQDVSKKIIKEIKNNKFKVEMQIQGDLIRVTSKSIDDLQEVIAFVKEYSSTLEIPIQFINFRS